MSHHPSSDLNLRACSILQSTLLEKIGEGEEVQTTIALSKEPFRYSYELQFDAMVESEALSGVSTKRKGLGDNAELQRRRARYLTALMLKLDKFDKKRVGKGLQILLPEVYKKMSKVDCSSPSQFWEGFSELLARHENDSETLHLLLYALPIWKPYSYRTLGGWEVVVRALSRNPLDKDLQRDALIFFIFFAEPPTDKEMIKATLEVLTEILQGCDCR